MQTPGSLSHFKRDEVPANNVDLTADNFDSLKYKAALVGNTVSAVNNTTSSVKNTELVFPLKYLISNIKILLKYQNIFWRSLEMPLINCKIRLELNRIEDCILPTVGHTAKFKIIDAKLHVPIVTLSTADLKDLFIGAVLFQFQTTPSKVTNNDTNLYESLSANFKV